MKYIELTQSKQAIVDDGDFDRLNKFKWFTQKTKWGCYAVRNIRNKYEKRKIYMHRLVIPCKKEQQIDHINHNGLDNRKENLRVCSNAENMRNSRKQPNCTSKYKGVSWKKSSRKWVVQIVKDRKKIYVGVYHNEIFAAGEYDKKAIELFGEFAELNFPITKPQ